MMPLFRFRYAILPCFITPHYATLHYFDYFADADATLLIYFATIAADADVIQRLLPIFFLRYSFTSR